MLVVSFHSPRCLHYYIVYILSYLHLRCSVTRIRRTYEILGGVYEIQTTFTPVPTNPLPFLSSQPEITNRYHQKIPNMNPKSTGFSSFHFPQIRTLPKKSSTAGNIPPNSTMTPNHPLSPFDLLPRENNVLHSGFTSIVTTNASTTVIHDGVHHRHP
jgi:hypothetical protein